MTLTTYRQGTPEWLAARAEGIGSSDAPVVCGESPYKSIYALWAEKTGRIAPQEPDERTARLFRIGHLLEPVLLGLYTEETGRKTRREARMLRHRDHPWMLASLDARAGKGRIVECKWTNARRWRDEDVPADVVIQVQHAMAVADAEVADVVALVGNDLRIAEVPRDDRLIGTIVDLEARFWSLVEKGIEPDVDGSEATRKALVALHPQDDGSEVIADDELDRLGLALLAAKDRAKEVDAEVGTLENALRALLGESAVVEGTGWRATYRRNAASTRVAWEAYSEGLARMLPPERKEEAETLRGIHTNVIPGPRVLRVTRRNEG